ncbi:facilitated trehalose transporter Tret1-2 homolog, partial [Pollicipes pollicipes]|uniref:facilitated trehalose transporter Tret1-2 homolog n=1 Tax=Pollicipes pollicipes TaxID=41117 RepID=UPI0018855EB6
LAALLVGRLLTGLAAGCATLVASPYTAEVAEARVRGPMGAMIGLQLALGILVSYTAGKYVAWRWLAVASGAVSVAWLLMVVAICESPLWLLQRSQQSQARTTLGWLRGGRSDADVPLAAVLLTLSLQQACGINAVTSYATEIFQESGSSVESNTAAILVGLTQVICTVAGVAAVHRFDRRSLLLTSAVLMALSLLALGAYFQLQASRPDVSAIGWLPLASIVAFIIAFSIGLGSIPYLLMGEVFSAEIRDAASGVAVFCNWTCAVLVTLTFAPLEHAITTAGVFWMYAIICLFGAVAMHFVVIETRGRTLDEIQQQMLG